MGKSVDNLKRYDLVKYDNKINTFYFRNLNAKESDLLFSILLCLKDKNLDYVEFPRIDFLNLAGIEKGNKQFRPKHLNGIFDKFTNLKISAELSSGDFKMFPLFKLCAYFAKKDIIYFQINEYFIYLLNDLKSNFTQFQLRDFITLKSKYAKTLFRLLSQFKATGVLYLDIESFYNLFDVDKEKYNRFTNIDQFILNPALKECLQFFKNLKLEKIKEKRKIIALKWSFTPQKEEDEIQQKDVLKPLEKRINHLGEEVSDLTPFINRHFLYKNGNRFEIYKITKIYQGDDNKIYLEGINQDTNKSFKSKSGFSSIEELENKINFI